MTNESSYYDLEFFSKIDNENSILHPSNLSRLRAAVQHANLQFAGQMRQYGSKFKVIDGPPELTELEEKEADDFVFTKYYQQAESSQLMQSHQEAVKWVRHILERSRGRELPGNFNPAIIGQLFREQSTHWAVLATDHVDKVADLCDSFVEQLLRTISTPDVYTKIYANIVEPELKARTERAHHELAQIIKDKNGEPITYNHYYTTTIQKLRAQKLRRKFQDFMDEQGHTTEDDDGDVRTSFDTTSLLQAMSSTAVEEDMDKFSAEDALICHLAYYKVSYIAFFTL